MKRSLLSRIWFAFPLAACHSIGTAHDVPARYPAHTEASFAELQTTVNRIVGSQVRLATDALTTSSTLTIAPDHPGTMQNPVPQGRIPGTPMQLKLMKGADSCYLVETATNAHYPLREADCETE